MQWCCMAQSVNAAMLAVNHQRDPLTMLFGPAAPLKRCRQSPPQGQVTLAHVEILAQGLRVSRG